MARLIFISALLSLSACTALYVPTDPAAGDGGAQDDGGHDAGVGPDAGTPVEPVTPVSCPISIERPCATETVVCSWDSTQTEHVASLRSGLFQVKGLNAVESTLGGEVLVTFKAPMAGAPLMVGFSVRRNSSLMEGGTHKLLIDVVPLSEDGTTPLIPAEGELPIASASYDVTNAQRDTDTPVTLVFESAATSKLLEGEMYALYFHLDSPGADDIALVGHTARTDELGTVYQRVSYFVGEDDLQHTPWVTAKQKSLNFFVTVGGPTPACSNPLALSPVYMGIAPCWTDVPAQCPNVNGVSGICSLDPNREPYEPVWPSLFQIIGWNPAEEAGLGLDQSLAITFSGARGVPLSLQFVLRRIAALTSPDSHEMVAEVIQVEEISTPAAEQSALSWKGAPIATGRFDLSTIPFSVSGPMDQRVSLNFNAAQNAVLDPNRTYAVYLHSAPGTIDRLGLAGTESDVNSGTNVYVRQLGTPPESAKTGLWGRVANRDLNFSLTFADVCSD